MREYLFSAIFGAAFVDLLLELLPLGANSKLKGYVRYIASLMLVLAIISPVVGLLVRAEKLSTDGYMYAVESYGLEMPRYIYVDESGVYESDEHGEMLSHETVFCDLYLSECCHNIASGIKDSIKDKFGIDKEELAVAVTIDTDVRESIELICVRVKVKRRLGLIRGDMIEYLSRMLKTEVYVEENDKEKRYE